LISILFPLALKAGENLPGQEIDNINNPLDDFPGSGGIPHLQYNPSALVFPILSAFQLPASTHNPNKSTTVGFFVATLACSD